MPIKGSTAFIGEYVFGGTAGAPLSTGSNGLLANGLNAIEVSSTTNATTTSGTAALITTMTVTPAAGTYIFWFSCTINSSNAGSSQTISAYLNGTQIPQSVRTISPFDGGALSAGTAGCGVAINGLITVTTGSLQIFWSTTGGTATVGARTLNLLRIA